MVRPLGRRRVRLAVLAVAAAGLAARLVLLGDRVAHWDEARVAWWQLQFLETGTYAYYPILHGPLLFHATRLVFDLLGVSDFAMRLPVALVGAALPLAALPLRTRLDDAETVALAVLLAADPLLLYYSRFMRSDLLVAAFSFGAFALLVAAHDTGRRRYALGAAPLLALAAASKENALLYVCCWVGAVLAAGVVRERAHEPLRDLRGHLAAARRVLARGAQLAAAGPVRHPLTAAVAAGEFLLVTVLLFAPRGAHEPSLGDALADPSLWPAVVGAATVGAAGRLVDTWLLGGLQGGSYPWYLLLLVGVTLLGSLPVVALSAYGVVADRPEPRTLVVVTVAWGLLSVGGYPVAVDIVGGWTAVHVVVPLTVPAAVGLAALARRARPAVAALRGSAPTGPAARRAALALLVLAGHVAVVGGLSSYVLAGSYYNMLGQPAQGDDDLTPTIETMLAVAHENAGTDVAFYGEYWAGGVHRRQPLAWYLRAGDHGRTGAARVRVALGANRSTLADDPPPVVVGFSFHRATLRELLPGYRCRSHELDYWSPREPGGESTRTLVFVDADAAPTYGSTRASQRCGSSNSRSVGRLSGSAHTAPAAASPRSSATRSKNARPRSY